MGIKCFLEFFGYSVSSGSMLLTFITVLTAVLRQDACKEYIKVSVVLLRKLHDITYHPHMGGLEDSVGICLNIHLEMSLQQRGPVDNTLFICLHSINGGHLEITALYHPCKDLRYGRIKLLSGAPSDLSDNLFIRKTLPVDTV